MIHLSRCHRAPRFFLRSGGCTSNHMVPWPDLQFSKPKSQEYTVQTLKWKDGHTLGLHGEAAALAQPHDNDNDNIDHKEVRGKSEKAKEDRITFFAAWLHYNWGTCERASSEWTSSVNRWLKCYCDSGCAQEKQSPWLPSEWCEYSCVPHEYLHAQPSFFVRPCTSRDSL